MKLYRAYMMSIGVLFWVISMISNRVEWAVRSCCGINSPYAGLLADIILFALGCGVGAAMRWYRNGITK